MSWLMIVAFICLGGFIGVVINSASKAKGKLLQQNFISLGTLSGRSLEEIKKVVGEPNAITACTTESGAPGSLYQWSQNPYSITLLFDKELICIGVNQEITM